jgi:membrane-bound metal-dependent hydrolase YbcI (DUF457 family)
MEGTVMANFKGHVVTAAGLGIAYGSFAFWHLQVELAPAILGAGLTTLGGLLPDLDSDKSVPNRTLFRLLGIGVALLALQHLFETSSSLLGGAIALAGSYFFVRYFLGYVFRRLTVHRGMFHSLPAMLIAGLGIYLLYARSPEGLRLFLAGGIMLGFFSHLLLDEICAVDLQGARLRKPFGTAVKLYSPSWIANTFTYSVLFTLAYMALRRS